MSVLLDRLERVKQTGPNRWIARCPAHPDHSPSLSVRELADGRILLHCFAGCPAPDVLAALGLQMSNLFPEPLGHHFRPTHSRIPARDLLALIDHEALAVYLIASEFMESKTLNEYGCERLATATSRIGKARLHPAGCDWPR